MKTNQLMKRDFMQSSITQRTKDGFFNATELLTIYNKNTGTIKSFHDFWINKNTKEFLKELENDIILNSHNNGYLKTHEATRGKGGATWMHPYLFVKFAMWLSPKFELQIIKWVYDNLIDYRNQAGDHYKEMCKAILDSFVAHFDKKPDPLIYQKEASFLNNLVYGASKGGKRNELSEKELELLNNLQKLNINYLKSGIFGDERRRKLTSYAMDFKIINNL